MRRLLLLTLVSAPLWAEMMDPINDLRVGISVVYGPQITETITQPNGTKGGYRWKGTGDIALRYDAGYYQGMSRNGKSRSGYIWNLGLNYLEMDVTPQAYVTGGQTFNNSRRDLALKLKQYGLEFGAGWASQPTPGSLGDLNWEIIPTVRGGLLSLDTVSAGQSPSIASGHAPYAEVGITGGPIIADKNWIIGLKLGWFLGQAKVSADLADGSTSDLTVTRNGPEASLHVGIRF